MNVDFKVEGCFVIMYGFIDFNGVQVIVMDFWVVVVLVIVGLVSWGYIEVINLKYFDWGYFNFYGKLVKLGVEIK